MEKYKLEYRGNVKEFEDYILDNLRREQEQGQSLRWSKFVEVYARQLAIIQECPYPETESELGNDETPPSIKLIDQNTEYVGSFYRWGLHVVGIGNFRVISCIHNYRKIVVKPLALAMGI